MRIIVVESGGSKSSWHIQSNGSHHFFESYGLNPYELNEDKKEDLTTKLNFISQKDDFNIFFYGSGCENISGQKNIRELISNLGFNNCSIQIETDLTGACIALLGNKKGTVGILGTGAISAVYNGKEVVQTFSGLGALLGDEGSGFDLGKRLLRAYFYNLLPTTVEKEIEAHFTSKEYIIANVYGDNGRRKVAELSKIIGKHKAIKPIKKLLSQSFYDFYKFALKPINDSGTVYLLGGIAIHFETEIKAVLNRYGYEVKKTKAAADKALFDYHLNKALPK